MAKLVEGNRIWTAVLGNPIDEGDVNALQTQVAAVAGPLLMPIPLYPYGDIYCAADGVPVAGQWTFQMTKLTGGYNPPYWQSKDHADGCTAWFPIPWTSTGMKITTMYARTKGVAALADPEQGHVKLVRRSFTAGTTADVATITAIPFQTGGIWWTCFAAVNHVVEAGYDYSVAVMSAGTPPTQTCQLTGLWAMVQLGV
jgi:hypothetical protein